MGVAMEVEVPLAAAVAAVNAKEMAGAPSN
jgi:hypothetical protein